MALTKEKKPKKLPPIGKVIFKNGKYVYHIFKENTPPRKPLWFSTY